MFVVRRQRVSRSSFDWPKNRFISFVLILIEIRFQFFWLEKHLKFVTSSIVDGPWIFECIRTFSTALICRDRWSLTDKSKHFIGNLRSIIDEFRVWLKQRRVKNERRRFDRKSNFFSVDHRIILKKNHLALKSFAFFFLSWNSSFNVFVERSENRRNSSLAARKIKLDFAFYEKTKLERSIHSVLYWNRINLSRYARWNLVQFNWSMLIHCVPIEWLIDEI